MKSFKLVVILMFLIGLTAFLPAQVLLEESFENDFPPEGWTTIHAGGGANQWIQISSTSNTGSKSAAIQYDASNMMDDYLVCAPVDLSGAPGAVLEFYESQQYWENYGAHHYVMISTTDAIESSFSPVLDMTPSNHDIVSSGFQKTVVDLSNFVGNETVYVALRYTGQDADNWIIDDVKIKIPYEHDVAAHTIVEGMGHYEPGSQFEPKVRVVNEGLNTESFSVNCVIYNDSEVYNQDVSVEDLQPNGAQTVTFPSFSLSANETFHIEFSTNLETDLDALNDWLPGVIEAYNGERRNVVVEKATGTWCGYCPASANGIEEMLENDLNIAVIEYHGGDDYETTEGRSRITYYGISGYPTAVFDGLSQVVGGGNAGQSTYGNYAPEYNSRIDVGTGMDIEIFGSHEESTYSVSVKITPTADVLYNDAVLHLAVTESEIAESWQGMSVLEFVQRDMVPDNFGTSIDFSQGDKYDPIYVPLTFTVDPSWNLDELELVAFVQVESTKDILQSTKRSLVEVETGIDDNPYAVNSAYLYQNSPNPFNPNTVISYKINAKAADFELLIYNVNGQVIKRFTNLESDENGFGSVKWDGSDVNGERASSGVYFYKLVSGDYSEVKKMMMLK